MTPKSLVEEAGHFGDLIQSEGWKALLVRVHDYLVTKNKELVELTYAMAFAKNQKEKENLQGRVITTEADLRAVSIMFSIPRNVIEAALQAREQAEQQAHEELEAPSDPLSQALNEQSNGKPNLVLASR